MKAKYIALSKAVENSWVTKVVGNVVVNKPGFSNKICCERRLAVYRALFVMVFWLRQIMLAEDIPIFEDMHRNMECSHALALKLNAKQDAFFEGVSVKHLEHGLGMHVDKQLDSTPGYNWSSVVAMTIMVKD